MFIIVNSSSSSAKKSVWLTKVNSDIFFPAALCIDIHHLHIQQKISNQEEQLNKQCRTMSPTATVRTTALQTDKNNSGVVKVVSTLFSLSSRWRKGNCSDYLSMGTYAPFECSSAVAVLLLLLCISSYDMKYFSKNIRGNKHTVATDFGGVSNLVQYILRATTSTPLESTFCLSNRVIKVRKNKTVRSRGTFWKRTACETLGWSTVS